MKLHDVAWLPMLAVLVMGQILGRTPLAKADNKRLNDSVVANMLGWLGSRAYQAHQVQEQRTLFLAAARQTALNLTTIDFHRANADLQRILDGATGQLYDNFSERSQPYIDVVMRTQSKSVGRVTEAAVESQRDDRAQVLVAVTVDTSNAVAPQPERHAWRMRLSVRQVGGAVKASNVEFVP